MQFLYGEFENEKKKGQIFFDLLDWGFEPWAHVKLEWAATVM